MGMKPKEFWIMGNKCHPHGHIVPDNYKKHGDLYIEKSAYSQIKARLESTEKYLSDTHDVLAMYKERAEGTDKLAEALECIHKNLDENFISPTAVMLIAHAEKALKEYRGEE